MSTKPEFPDGSSDEAGPSVAGSSDGGVSSGDDRSALSRRGLLAGGAAVLGAAAAASFIGAGGAQAAGLGDRTSGARGSSRLLAGSVTQLRTSARAEGVGGVMTMVLRNFKDKVNELLGVPVEEGWTMSAMLALGYPRGNGVSQPIGAPCMRFHREITGMRHSASRSHSRCGRLGTTASPSWPRRDESIV